MLLVTVLLGYLEAAKADAVPAADPDGDGGRGRRDSASTFFVLRTVLAALPFGREVLEAITALDRGGGAVLRVVLARRAARAEALARVPPGTGVERGIGRVHGCAHARRVHRGVPRRLRDRAVLPSAAVVRPGLGVWVAAGLAAGVVALAAVSWLIFRLGRRVPVKAFLSAAVVLLMATSIAFLGNAVRSLQEADVVALHRWPAGRERRSSCPSRSGTGRAARRSPRKRSSPPCTWWAPCTSSCSGPGCVASASPAVGAGSEVTVRVGVDVGGTFTKAVAYDIDRGKVVAEAIVPTTHAHADGVAAGVVEVVAQLAKRSAPRMSSSSRTRRRRP